MLEQLIAGDPENLDNWAVYIDHLLAVQPEVGERAALGLALVRSRDEAERERLRAEINEFEREQAEAWFGPKLAPVVAELEAEGSLELDRRFGLILGASLRESPSKLLEIGVVLRALLDSPVARTLRSLQMEVNSTSSTYLGVVNSLIEHRPPTLRQLRLAGRTTFPHVKLPRSQTLLDRMPHLERLELHGYFGGAATHASLRELKLAAADPPHWPFARWRLPALEVLHVEWSSFVDWSQVQLPRLGRLLISFGGGDELLANLASSSLLAQLDSLVLVGTYVSEAGVATLERHADRFATIRELVLLDANLVPQRCAELQRAWPNMLVRSGQRTVEPDLLERNRLTKF